MYGFPEQNVLSGIVDKNLTMVCCNANQIYLHFDYDMTISVNKNCFQIELGKELFKIGVPIDNLSLFRFIEQKVVNIEVNSEKTVCIIFFENGGKVILEDDEHYESFVISINGKEILV